MNVLVLTNLFPTKRVLSGGIFITKRLQQYKKIGVNFAVIPVLYGNRKLKRFIGRLFGKQIDDPVSAAYDVRYLTIDHAGIYEFFLHSAARFFGRSLGYLSMKSYLNYLACLIESNIDVSSFDIIHAHGMFALPAGFLGKILAEKYNKPYVISLHGDDVNFIMKHRKYYVDILESSNAVIFVSETLLKTAKSHGYSGKNAIVIPNGYDPEIFKSVDKAEVRKKLNIYKEGHKYVGFVGSLDVVKRADSLVKIFSKVKKHVPDTIFIVVGDGPLKDILKRESRECNLDVYFTGFVQQEEAARFMNAMDVMILPSRNEGWGCVVKEAQACGTCVVGSSNGGIPEAIGFPEYVVEEGENFEDRFAKKVVEILINGYDRNAIINNAKEYTWENVVSKEKRLYEEVLKGFLKSRQSSYNDTNL